MKDSMSWHAAASQKVLKASSFNSLVEKTGRRPPGGILPISHILQQRLSKLDDFYETTLTIHLNTSGQIFKSTTMYIRILLRPLFLHYSGQIGSWIGFVVGNATIGFVVRVIFGKKIYTCVCFDCKTQRCLQKKNKKKQFQTWMHFGYHPPKKRESKQSSWNWNHTSALNYHTNSLVRGDEKKDQTITSFYGWTLELVL